MITYTYTQLWLLAALIFILFEMSAPGLFYSFSFACGASIAGIVAYQGLSLTGQFIAFLVGSFISLLILKFWVKRINKPNTALDTNMYALKGKRGVIVKVGTVDQFAQVRVRGETWSAQAFNNKPLRIGTLVKVIKVTGVRLVVEINTK